VNNHLAAVLEWLGKIGSIQTVERFQIEKRRDRWVLYRRLADHSYPCDEETFRTIAGILDRDKENKRRLLGLPPRKLAEAAGLDPAVRPQVGVALAFLKAVQESRDASIFLQGGGGRCSLGSASEAWGEVSSRGGLWRHAELGWLLFCGAEEGPLHAAEQQEGSHARQSD
jgi:hypothetical protein